MYQGYEPRDEARNLKDLKDLAIRKDLKDLKDLKDPEAKMLSLQSFLRKGVSLGYVGRNKI